MIIKVDETKIFQTFDTFLRNRKCIKNRNNRLHGKSIVPYSAIGIFGSSFRHYIFDVPYFLIEVVVKNYNQYSRLTLIVGFRFEFRVVRFSIL